MKVVVLKERRPFEKRVAATPDSVKRLVALGCEMIVEKDAGWGALIPDEAYHATRWAAPTSCSRCSGR